MSVCRLIKLLIKLFIILNNKIIKINYLYDLFKVLNQYNFKYKIPTKPYLRKTILNFIFVENMVIFINFTNVYIYFSFRETIILYLSYEKSIIYICKNKNITNIQSFILNYITY